MEKIKRSYNISMSDEMTELCDTLNSLPGIETICHSIGKTGGVPISIWLYSKNPIGLFIITRCTDKRYWCYGNDWDITLEVGDQFKNDYLPTTYWLHPNKNMNEDLVYEQMNSLTKNIEQHLNHTAFLNGYNINLEEHYRMIINFNRKQKIKKIHEKNNT